MLPIHNDTNAQPHPTWNHCLFSQENSTQFWQVAAPNEKDIFLLASHIMLISSELIDTERRQDTLIDFVFWKEALKRSFMSPVLWADAQGFHLRSNSRYWRGSSQTTRASLLWTWQASHAHTHSKVMNSPPLWGWFDLLLSSWTCPISRRRSHSRRRANHLQKNSYNDPPLSWGSSAETGAGRSGTSTEDSELVKLG